MIKKLNKAALTASLPMGGFIGWTLAIMCICQQNLRYYHDESLLRSVNTTFLTAGTITGAVLVVILLLIDFDGLLGDRLLRWLPGVLMAEAGIAVALANVGTMTAFAAIAGVAASLGAMAVFTHLLRIKVGQRMTAIGFGLAIGGVIRLIVAASTAHASRTGLVVAASLVGVLAALTVHSRAGSEDHGGILVALAEASPRTIISKVPLVYVILPVLAGAFWLAHSHIQSFAEAKLPAGYEGYDIASYIGFIIAALIAALFVRLSRLALLFAVGTGFAAAAGMLASLPYLTDTEAGFFAMMSFGSLACTRACIYLFIIVFSLDRPHPLFYAMFGYTVSNLAELAGVWLDGRIHSWPLSRYILILLLLMPLGGALLHAGMRRYGFSQDKLDHRKMISGLVKKRSAELELSEREQSMLESIVLDGSGVEELAGHMLFSHNTVKVLLRPVYKKLGASSPEELREQFERAADSEAEFRARVHAAEDEKRIADRAKARQEKREQRELERRERERQDQEELERKLLEMETMNQLLGSDEAADPADSEPAEDQTADTPEDNDEAASPAEAETEAVEDTDTDTEESSDGSSDAAENADVDADTAADAVSISDADDGAEDITNDDAEPAEDADEDADDSASRSDAESTDLSDTESDTESDTQSEPQSDAQEDDARSDNAEPEPESTDSASEDTAQKKVAREGSRKRGRKGRK